MKHCNVISNWGEFKILSALEQLESINHELANNWWVRIHGLGASYRR